MKQPIGYVLCWVLVAVVVVVVSFFGGSGKVCFLVAKDKRASPHCSAMVIHHMSHCKCNPLIVCLFICLHHLRASNGGGDGGGEWYREHWLYAPGASILCPVVTLRCVPPCLHDLQLSKLPFANHACDSTLPPDAIFCYFSGERYKASCDWWSPYWMSHQVPRSCVSL